MVNKYTNASLEISLYNNYKIVLGNGNFLVNTDKKILFIVYILGVNLIIKIIGKLLCLFKKSLRDNKLI